MIPRILIDTANIPGGDELRLFQRGDDFMIVLDRNELMSSRMNGSEIALAEMTIERLAINNPKILIGGYGMGFTLRAALAKLGSDAKIRVAELVPQIIKWAKGPMAHITNGCLDDPRVELSMGDVGNIIDDAPFDGRKYDAILLDVDNGPDGLTRQENDGLYSKTGLNAAHLALNEGGILAIWSAAPDPVFKRRLERAHFDVDEVRVTARTNGKGAKHVIWFAHKK
ncbi:spermidine synthase [Sphingorhabdus lutea]|uniref:Spermidine synthase n=1 Tax=Sphingorhabdus lutea TaxID=1913578 RepID=A0A1L3J9P2_9SPHN|nr:spermidine synthase [Sphingorhabdus lutea]APG61847.1 spermidine synthase [Sphingorhabdus lutea]